jgi:hypothetical protein
MAHESHTCPSHGYILRTVNYILLYRVRCRWSPVGSSYKYLCKYISSSQNMVSNGRPVPKAQTNTLKINNIYTSPPPLDVPLGRCFNIHGCRETSVNGIRSSGLYLSSCKVIRVYRLPKHGVDIPALSGLWHQERREMEF